VNIHIYKCKTRTVYSQARCTVHRDKLPYIANICLGAAQVGTLHVITRPCPLLTGPLTWIQFGLGLNNYNKDKCVPVPVHAHGITEIGGHRVGQRGTREGGTLRGRYGNKERESTY
jgi:hypothetical protein